MYNALASTRAVVCLKLPTICIPEHEDEPHSHLASCSLAHLDVLQRLELLLLNKVVEVADSGGSSQKDRQNPLNPRQAGKLDVVLLELGISEMGSACTMDADEPVKDDILNGLGVRGGFNASSQNMVMDDCASSEHYAIDHRSTKMRCSRLGTTSWTR